MKKTKDKALVEATEQELKERDDKMFDELKSIVGGITRARFRVRPDYRSEAFVAMMFLSIVIVAGAILLNISKSTTGIIVISVIMAVVVAIAVGVMASYIVKSKKVFYCYYFNTERGVFCMSVIGETATVFAGGVAYRIERDKFYTLDEEGYRLWLDGEGAGLYSVMNCSRGDFEVTDDGVCFVNNPKGGGHELHLADGKITSIVSIQPFSTDVVELKTGEQKIKTRVYEKTDMEVDFEWEIPEFVKNAFDGARAELPDVSGL